MVLKRVALTGASGMLGRHVLDALATRAISCVATSRTEPKNFPAGSVWKPWDLAEVKSPEQLDELFGKVDALLHVGAFVPSNREKSSFGKIAAANITATACLAEWALKSKIPFLFVSGSTVYAAPDREGIQEADEKTYTGLGGFYGTSKLLAEEVLLHAQGDGLKLCILRPSSIYGSGMAGGKMLTNFLKDVLKNGSLTVNPPVDDRVDLVHAADVASAMLDALGHEAFGVFNIASGSPVSIRQIAEACVKAAGKGRVNLPGAADAEKNPEPRVRFGLDCSKARKHFGFSPRLTIEAGIAEMVESGLY